MSEMLDKWLAHYDPIHRGWTPRGVANGVCATNGFAFPRVGGGYNLYRGADGAIDDGAPVGATGSKAQSITTFAWRRHQASNVYRYALRAIGGGGVESASSASMVTVDFDAAGDPAPLRPNSPGDLVVGPLAGGRIEVSWSYDARGEEASPSAFQVFSDGGSGAFDWETPIGAVAYRARAGRFRLVSGAHGHDCVVAFAVRAVTAAADDGNEVVKCARARAAEPAPHEAVLIEICDA
jgi:hypothetical protein